MSLRTWAIKKAKVASHDVGLHLLALVVPYQKWLELHESNAIWAGLLPESARGSWRLVPLALGNVPSRLRAAVHDAFIHPLSTVLPFPTWARLHNRNAVWAFGAVERDRDPNPVPEP